MTEKSIIFFDIDGTLYDHDKQLPRSAKEAIMKLKEKGHLVAIATGRAPFMYDDLREELGIDTYVSYNGQYVVLNGEVLYTNPLKQSSLLELTEMALKNDHPIVYMDDEDMKANVQDHQNIKTAVATLKIKHLPKHNPNYYEGRDLYQSLLFCPEGTEEQYVNHFTDFDFIRWHPLSVDVLPRGGSKARGIEKIIQALDIPADRQYAFGDAMNDMEMLQSVENSVAMGNAAENVKAAAKYVTKSVDDNGIEYGLQMVGLLEK